MQKLNLNHIPEAPENKDFWVVGTANREGSIDSNSYKKNLSALATKNNSSSYYVDTYPQNPKEGDIITFTDDTPSKKYVNGEWKDRSAEGGGLPQITLLQKPVADGGITIGDYFSSDDLAKLEESGVAVAKYGTSNYVVVCEYDLNMSSSSLKANFAFYGPEGLEFILKHQGSFTAPWSVEMVPAVESNVLELTNMPSQNGTFTQAQLDTMGFTAANIQKICEGKITHLKQTASVNDVPFTFIVPLMSGSGTVNDLWLPRIYNVLPDPLPNGMFDSLARIGADAWFLKIVSGEAPVG